VSRVAVYTPAYLSRSKSESLVNILLGSEDELYQIMR
jgi:hypothetical protein